MSYREDPVILTDTDYLRTALAVENQVRLAQGLKPLAYDQLSPEESLTGESARPVTENDSAKTSLAPDRLRGILSPHSPLIFAHIMTTTLARREVIAIRDQLTILQNVVAVNRLDLIAPSVARIELSVQRLESIDGLINLSLNCNSG